MWETYDITYVDLLPISAQTKGKLLSATTFKRSYLVQKSSVLFETCTVGRVFSTPVEFGSPHEAIRAGFVDVCFPILNSY
jgi:hypothetical protein